MRRSKELVHFVTTYFRPKTGYTLRRQVAYWPYDEQLYKLMILVEDEKEKEIIRFMQENEMQLFSLMEAQKKEGKKDELAIIEDLMLAVER